MPEALPDPYPVADTTCTACGALMAVGGRCAQCLLRLALEVDSLETDPFFETLRWQGFGDYEVIEEIARGGMGVVYRARQRSLEREVALKMILAGELAGKKALRMFQIEAQAAANLHHPNIVPVYEIGEHEMQNYFTMRYIPGGRTVADWAASRRDDPRAVAGVVAKISRAVAYAHERGVLHCDLKPSNVLWDPKGEPLVTDFGLAKLLDQAEPVISYTAIVGSPSYMAPEQVDQELGNLTTATDVYGIGALLYEMLSGNPPFNGGSTLEVLRKVSQDSPGPLSYVPKDLVIVCMKCLAKRPADRYSTASALADDLERFARGEPVSAVPLTWPQTVWRWALRKPRSAALLLFCMCCLLFGMTGLVMQWIAVQRANRVQAEALERGRWREIERWQQEGDVSQPLTYLASLVREKPTNWQASMYAMSIAEQMPVAVPAGPAIPVTAASVASARLSPDGSWVVTADRDAWVRMWETATGRPIRQFQLKSPCVALAAGDQVPVVAALENGEVVALPALDAEPVPLIRSSRSFIKEMRLSADGSFLAAIESDGVEVWCMEALQQESTRMSFEGSVKGGAISSDGQRLMAWGQSKACVWETAGARTLLNVQANSERGFNDASLSADGQKIALIDGSYDLRAWDISTQTEMARMHSELSSMLNLALSADGSRLTAAGAGNQLWLYDTKSGLNLKATARHHYHVQRLLSDKQGRFIYSFGTDGAMCVSDAFTGEAVVGSFKVGNFQDDVFIDPSHDGRTFLVHSGAKKAVRETVSIWQSTTPKAPSRHHVAEQRDFYFSRLSPDGRLGCLSLHPGNRCYIYDLKSGRVWLDKKAAGNVYVTLFSPDMRKAYALTANGWVHGWSLDSGEELWPPNQQPGKIRPALITADGTRLIVGHNDGHIRIYDTGTGKVIQVLDHPGEIKTLRLAPGAKELLLSGSTDKLAHVWDLRTGLKRCTLEGHRQTIIASGWSPDGRYVATASYDRTARIWSVETGKPVGAVMRHETWLSHLEFSPDGTQIATACRDGTARLWHADTGEPFSLPMEQGSTCETVRFTQDGAALLVRDHSGFRFWDTTRGEPITMHYQEPVSGGLGMDSESHRAIMNTDGTVVFLASSMNYGALWTISQARGIAPPWFPDFLDALAGSVFNQAEENQGAVGRWLKLREEILTSPDQSIYYRWARSIITPAAPVK